MLVAGGYNGISVFAGAELYNPSRAQGTVTGSMNTARERQTATLLQNGQVLVTGGDDGFNTVASAELYTP